MVQTVPGNTWIDGGEENVAVAKTIHYTADEVKAGDYIYSGRSTSDGGLRKRYPNGKAQVIADPKPQSVAGKTVAGVVFCIPKDTDPTGRLTPARLTDDKIMMKDFPRCLQNYRDNGLIPYSNIGGKFFYREVDIQEILESGLTKRK